ncbi:hypothetical protein HY387_00995 [Candidatus Daviesbacteria bacterium]|nr:hypothetical protein [Candidatus Daviesbacteria bacterium]
MGRQTKNFRQSAKSMSGSKGAQNFAKINRNAWHMKVINFLKFRGKNYGQS